MRGWAGPCSLQREDPVCHGGCWWPQVSLGHGCIAPISACISRGVLTSACVSEAPFLTETPVTEQATLLQQHLICT